MSVNQDPVSEIKKSEERSQKEVEKYKKDLDEELRQFEENLIEEKNKFEQSLKDQGQKNLNNAKQEATEIYKTKLTSLENGKRILVKEAENRKKEAIKKVIDTFVEYLKS